MGKSQAGALADLVILRSEATKNLPPSNPAPLAAPGIPSAIELQPSLPQTEMLPDAQGAFVVWGKPSGIEALAGRLAS